MEIQALSASGTELLWPPTPDRNATAQGLPGLPYISRKGAALPRALLSPDTVLIPAAACLSARCVDSGRHRKAVNSIKGEAEAAAARTEPAGLAKL